MIINLLVTLFAPIIVYFLQQLNDVQLNSGIATMLETVTGYASALNAFLPIDVLLGIIIFDIAFETGYLIFKTIYWIIRRFPTQS